MPDKRGLPETHIINCRCLRQTCSQTHVTLDFHHGGHMIVTDPRCTTLQATLARAIEEARREVWRSAASMTTDRTAEEFERLGANPDEDEFWPCGHQKSTSEDQHDCK